MNVHESDQLVANVERPLQLLVVDVVVSGPSLGHPVGLPPVEDVEQGQVVAARVIEPLLGFVSLLSEQRILTILTTDKGGQQKFIIIPSACA